MTAVLPSDPGSYALVLRNRAPLEVVVGKLGPVAIERGYLLYVGSARGPGGLRARVGRHARGRQIRHWHIDYLRPYVELEEVWLTMSSTNREHTWASSLGRHLDIAHPRFGASDCRCEAHLFFSARRPSAGLVGGVPHQKVQDGIVYLPP